MARRRAQRGRGRQRQSGERKRRRHRGTGVEVAQMVVEDEQPNCEPGGGKQDRSGCEQRRATPRHVDADERDHAGEAGHQPDQPASADALRGLMRSVSAATISGTAATMIAASDDAT